ncbi:MAG: hypothetical protein U0744_11740 [Gemmataceae bacterium]
MPSAMRDANKQWTIDAQLSVSLNETPSRPIAAKVQAKLVEEPASVQADLAWQEGDAGELTCKFEAWPLAMAAADHSQGSPRHGDRRQVRGDMKGMEEGRRRGERLFCRGTPLATPSCKAVFSTPIASPWPNSRPRSS